MTIAQLKALLTEGRVSEYFLRRCARDPGLGVVESEEIDRINILQASLKAMELAVTACQPRPTFLLLDAVTLSAWGTNQEGLIGGDGLCACIAAASIVAKVYRDRLMAQLD